MTRRWFFHRQGSSHRPRESWKSSAHSLSDPRLCCLFNTVHRRFTVDEPSVLLSRVHGREQVPSCDPIGRCEACCQTFMVGLSAEHEVPQRFE